MAVTKETYSRYAKIAFENGYDDEGNVKVATNSYQINLDATVDVIYPIMEGLGNLKEAALNGVRMTENSDLVSTEA